MGRSIIVWVEGKGYFSGYGIGTSSLNYTSDPLAAKQFTEHEVWHQETRLNGLKYALESRSLGYEERILEYTVRRRYT